MTASAARVTTINLRATAVCRTLIDEAATVLGKSRTDFMLDAASERAQQVLLDRTVFALDAQRIQQFNRLLDAPIANRKALKKLLNREAPWESQ